MDAGWEVPHNAEFVHHARGDTLRLIRALRGQGAVPDLDEIERRCDAASPAPWRAFLESDGGIGGCSVIWVGRDDEPDLYLWLDGELAPDADFVFVAAAREDLPALVAAARELDPR